MILPSANRLLSAFLFAIVLIATLYFAVWYNAMKRTEEGLVSSLHDILGGDISYDYAIWDYDLTKIGITVKNTVSHFRDSTNNITYIHSLGDLVVSSDFFQNFHILIKLPQQHKVEIERQKEIIHAYRINLDKASLSFYPNIEGGELAFTTNAIHIIDNENGDKILSSSEMFFVKSGGGRTVHPNLWQLSTNKLIWNIPLFNQPITLYSILFESELKRFPALTMKDLYSLLLEKDKYIYGAVLTEFVNNLYNRGSTIDIKELNIAKQKDDWTSISGDLKINENLQPTGIFSVSTNQPLDVMDWFINKNIARETFLAENYNLKKLFKKEDLLSISLSLKKDVTYINGLIAGKVDPITSIIGIK